MKSLLFCILLPVQATLYPSSFITNEKPEYHITTPELVEISSDASSLKVKLELSPGDLVELDLWQSRSLMPAQYTSFVFGRSQQKRRLQQVENCFYGGKISLQDSRVALGSCDGMLHGLIQRNGQVFVIEPAHLHFEDIERQASNVKRSLQPVVVVKGAFESQPAWDFLKRAPLKKARKLQQRSSKEEPVLELLVVNDVFRMADKSIEEVELDTLRIVFIASEFLMDLKPHLELVLAGQIFLESDEMNSEHMDADIESLYDEFRVWKRRNLNKLPSHDHLHLLSGKKPGEALGIAARLGACDELDGCKYVDDGMCAVITHSFGRTTELCCNYAASVTMAGSVKLGIIANTMAHELGHVLGMEHDEASCDNEAHIMGTSLSTKIGALFLPFKWSSCSHRQYEEGLSQLPCLFERVSEACGNGLVDEGEECDCGETDCSDVNPCCDGRTCKLKWNAMCSASDPCCTNTCELKPKGATCRASSDPCDAEETCSGIEATCPEDKWLEVGSFCSDEGDFGTCWPFNGMYKCLNRARMCGFYGLYGGKSVTNECQYNGRWSSVNAFQLDALDGNGCDAFYCFSDPSECSRPIQMRFVQERGFPCRQPVDGMVTHVCDGVQSFWSNSQCRPVEDRTFQSETELSKITALKFVSPSRVGDSIKSEGSVQPNKPNEPEHEFRSPTENPTRTYIPIITTSTKPPTIEPQNANTDDNNEGGTSLLDFLKELLSGNFW